MVRVSCPQKRPCSELIAKMLMGVVPGLVIQKKTDLTKHCVHRTCQLGYHKWVCLASLPGNQSKTFSLFLPFSHRVVTGITEIRIVAISDVSGLDLKSLATWASIGAFCNGPVHFSPVLPNGVLGAICGCSSRKAGKHRFLRAGPPRFANRTYRDRPRSGKFRI